MAGTWMAIVLGFGGMRPENGGISFRPMIPDKWKKYAFHVNFRGSLLFVMVSREGVSIENRSERPVNIRVYDTEERLDGYATRVFQAK